MYDNLVQSYRTMSALVWYISTSDHSGYVMYN